MALTANEIISEMTKSPPQLVLSGDPSRAQGCSYDMTIGTIFWDKKIHNEKGTTIVVPPGGVVSILTQEELHLPDNVFATAFAINSMSSKGFLVLNPGHVDPGFKGPLSVRALNVRKVDLPLPIGEPVFTVIFQRLSESVAPYAGNIVNRETREREYNRAVIELCPKTIFEMMEKTGDGPFPSRDEVGLMITTKTGEVESKINKQIYKVLTLSIALLGLLFSAYEYFESPSSKTSHDATQVQSRQSETGASAAPKSQSEKSNPPEEKR